MIKSKNGLLMAIVGWAFINVCILAIATLINVSMLKNGVKDVGFSIYCIMQAIVYFVVQANLLAIPFKRTLEY